MIAAQETQSMKGPLSFRYENAPIPERNIATQIAGVNPSETTPNKSVDFSQNESSGKNFLSSGPKSTQCPTKRVIQLPKEKTELIRNRIAPMVRKTLPNLMETGTFPSFHWITWVCFLSFIKSNQ